MSKVHKIENCFLIIPIFFILLLLLILFPSLPISSLKNFLSFFIVKQRKKFNSIFSDSFLFKRHQTKPEKEEKRDRGNVWIHDNKRQDVKWQKLWKANTKDKEETRNFQSDICQKIAIKFNNIATKQKLWMLLFLQAPEQEMKKRFLKNFFIRCQLKFEIHSRKKMSNQYMLTQFEHSHTQSEVNLNQNVNLLFAFSFFRGLKAYDDVEGSWYDGKRDVKNYLHTHSHVERLLFYVCLTYFCMCGCWYILKHYEYWVRLRGRYFRIENENYSMKSNEDNGR